jgi:hypothetical protein
MRSFPASDPYVLSTLIFNCPKRKETQSFCGKSHFTSSNARRLFRLAQLIRCTGSTRQPKRRKPRPPLPVGWAVRNTYVRATTAQCTSFTRHRHATHGRSLISAMARNGSKVLVCVPHPADSVCTGHHRPLCGRVINCDGPPSGVESLQPRHAGRRDISAATVTPSSGAAFAPPVALWGREIAGLGFGTGLI